MIKDKLCNAEYYYGLSNNLKKGFEWLKNTDLKNLKDGKYFIENETVYANVQTYETKDQAPYERHHKYIDIQYMIDGTERIGVCDYTNCSVEEPYQEEKDIEFMSCKNEEEFHTLSAGEFLIFYPQDAHKPSLKTDKRKIVKKVVIKVAI